MSVCGGSTNFNVLLFDGDCDSLFCLEQTTSSCDGGVISTESCVGCTYNILVYGGQSDFDITIECIPEPSNSPSLLPTNQ